jgi:hypothetical protein
MAMHKLITERNEEDMALVKFVGGSLDGNVYTTETLLSDATLSPHILDYVWTSERVTSESTGAVAQIWRHKNETQPEEPGGTHRNARLGALQEMKSSIDGVTDGAVAPPIPETSQTSSASSGAAAAHVATDHPVEPVSAPVGESNGAVDATSAASIQADGDVDLTGSSLRSRREALKPRVSRDVIAAMAGMATSRVFNIENEKPTARITQKDRMQLAAAIARAETGDRSAADTGDRPDADTDAVNGAGDAGGRE